MKLTRTAAAVHETDIETLRGHGLSDTDVSDAIQVIGYFNYVTRIADGIGIGAEPEWEARASHSAESPLHP